MTKVKALLATAVLVVLAALFGAGVIATSAVAEAAAASSNTLTGMERHPIGSAPSRPSRSRSFGGQAAHGERVRQAHGPVRRLGANRRPTQCSRALFTASIPRESSRRHRRSTGPSSWVCRNKPYISRVSVYDASDHLVQNVVAKASGVRMPVERISDVP